MCMKEIKGGKGEWEVDEDGKEEEQRGKRKKR